jgi:LysM domain
VTSAGRAAATVRLAAWSAALVAGARVLVATGRGSLSVPLGSADDLADWVGAASPAEMAMAVLRLLALAACGYLLAVTALGVAARVVRARGLTAAVDRVTPAVVRRIVAGGSGAGLVLGTLVASLPAPDLTGPPGASTATASPAATATMARVPAPTATMARTTPGPAGGEATMTRLEDPTTTADPATPSATMTRVGPERSAEPVAATAVTVASAAAPVLPAAPALPAVDAATWLVAAGDSLWSIAEEIVRTAQPDAADRTVTRYWRALTDANRASLVDPANPDLLVPGQQLTLPPFTG